MPSAVLIVPIALKSAADMVGAAMGWGPENYTLPISADGGVTLTHYACRTDVTPAFLEQVANPPPIPGVAAVLSALIVDLSESLWGGDHLAAALVVNGMVHHAG
jgi:hypothetical protein